MSKYNEILGKISSIGQTVTQAGSAISSLVSNESESASTIRDTYLNGFFGETSIFSPNVFSRLFDEPTYLSFRIKFNFDTDSFENKTSINMLSQIGSLDLMPEPLLSMYEYNSTNSRGGSRSGVQASYSTYDYLKRGLGEIKRATMLKLFINALKDIQDNYPYYFQSVTGIGDLLKTAPGDGIRLKDGENIITIKCLEGLDMKITQLMQLYKNVAWDDYYQRWILSDMMRFFNVKIYISEIRLFHSSNISNSRSRQGIVYPFGSSSKVLNANSIDKLYDSSLLSSINNLLNIGSSISSRLLGTNSAVTQTMNSINQTVDTVTSLDSGMSSAMYHLCNNAINDVMPTICLDCHMCEFDIEETLAHINELSSSNKNTESPAPEIKIKVGKLFIRQIYPLNSQLTANGNGYELNINDNNGEKDLIRGSVIDDEMLMESNFYTDASTSKDVYNSEITNIINKDAVITKSSIRMNPKIEDPTKFSYRPGKGGPEMAAMALTEGILNQTVKNGPRSTATQDDALKNAIKNNTALRNINNRVTRIAENYGPEALRNALNALGTIRDTVLESEDIRSAATDPNMQRQLQENVMSEVLENISKSNATDDTKVLKDLADIILDDTKSVATNQSNLRFNELN